MKKEKFLSVMSLLMIGASAMAADQNQGREAPAAVVPGIEAATLIPMAKGHHMIDPGPMNSEESGPRLVSRGSIVGIGILGSDAALRTYNIATSRTDLGKDPVDHYLNVGAGGLGALAGQEYFRANKKVPTGSRGLGAAALTGAAALSAQGDRKKSELAVGSAATAISLDQVAASIRNSASRKVFFSSRMGAATAGVLAATLFGDVYLAEQRSAGERSSSKATSVNSSSKDKAKSSSLGNLIEEKASRSTASGSASSTQ